MPYSEFTLKKVKQTFGLTTVEGERFLPKIESITPSSILTAFLEESLPVAIASLLPSADRYGE